MGPAGRPKDPVLFGKLLARRVAGPVVIGPETLQRRSSEAPGEADRLCIHEEDNGKIVKARLRKGRPPWLPPEA